MSRSTEAICSGKSMIFVIKLQRAVGGCLGIDRRRRTRKPAISFGELERSCDPENSEWGNPVGVISHYLEFELIELQKQYLPK
jgi:hypothetical protein